MFVSTCLTETDPINFKTLTCVKFLQPDDCHLAELWSLCCCDSPKVMNLTSWVLHFFNCRLGVPSSGHLPLLALASMQNVPMSYLGCSSWAPTTTTMCVWKFPVDSEASPTLLLGSCAKTNLCFAVGWYGCLSTLHLRVTGALWKSIIFKQLGPHAWPLQSHHLQEPSMLTFCLLDTDSIQHIYYSSFDLLAGWQHHTNWLTAVENSCSFLPRLEDWWIFNHCIGKVNNTPGQSGSLLPWE